MESQEDLAHLISSFEAEGSNEGTGSFGLDPHRALDMLAEQGRLGDNAALFLLWALHQHTGGAPLTWKRTVFSHQLMWPEEFGELPKDTYRILAGGAFEANSLKLTFQPGQVTFQSEFFGDPFSVNFDKTFGLAEPRLQHYPVKGLFTTTETLAPSLTKKLDSGELQFHLAEFHDPQLRWIVHGIEFAEPSPLPLSFTIFDDQLRPDLSLTNIPESERKSCWLEEAERLFREWLYEELLVQDPLLLDSERCPEELPRALHFLPYIVSLPQDSALRKASLDLVRLRDVFGLHWALGDLLQRHDSDGGILVVPSVPTDCPAHSSGKRPVLLWVGDGKRLGQRLFQKISSGAGYLYSLQRGAAVKTHKKKHHDPVLAWIDLDEGRLSLKKPGQRSARCEVELVGERRASEKVYLDEPAPASLRLVWASPDGIPSWKETKDFLRHFQCGVVELVDRELPKLETTPPWRRSLLTWAKDVGSLDPYPNLFKATLFEGVRGVWYSLDQLREAFGAKEPIPILQDRSTSLPEELPLPIVLWDHPLLERLQLAVQEVGAQVRQAYWREDGRKKWLKRFQSASPLTLPELQAERRVVLEEGHILATREEDDPSVLVLWREGRPLGKRPIPSAVWPTGFTVVYLDDEFPADTYWGGPDSKAVQSVFDWLIELRQNHSLSELLASDKEAGKDNES